MDSHSIEYGVKSNFKSIISSDFKSNTSSEGELSPEDRLKRWENRRKDKRRVAAAKKKMSQQVSLGSNIEDLIKQKGLPITSLDFIGSGSFAKVYKGVWTKNSGGCEANSPVALKVINIDRICLKLHEDGKPIAPKWLRREVDISHILEHENLIQVIESSTSSLPYVIVLEYCPGGTLRDAVSGDPKATLDRFSWHQRLKAALDIAAGMERLHQHQIVHRDLKPQNVLLLHPVLTANDVVHAKVCDFGLARYLPEADHQTVMTLQVGSWHFMAPELFVVVANEENPYAAEVDMYSYGMLLYYMLAGDLFFPNESMTIAEFVTFASTGGRPREDAIPATAPEVLRITIKEALQARPSFRPSFSEIVNRLRESHCKFPLTDPEPKSVTLMLGGFASWFCCLLR